MQQDEPVGPPLPREVGEHAVELALHFFLADERVAPRPFGFPRKIEELEARQRAPRALDLRRAVVVEHVAQVARRVASVAHRIGGEELQVFLERKDAPPFFEAAFDGGGDLVEMRQCPLPRALVH